MKDLFDWQDYEEYEIPKNARTDVYYLQIAENKPEKSHIGFCMYNGGFTYNKNPFGKDKLWIRFVEEIEE